MQQSSCTPVVEPAAIKPKRTIVKKNTAKPATATTTTAKRRSTRKKKCILRISEVNNIGHTATVFTFISGDSNKKYQIEYRKDTKEFTCNCGDQFNMATKRSECKHINAIQPMKDFFANDEAELDTDELADFLNKIL